MSLAADARAAARARPFLVEALRAGVVNYAAAARSLDVAEDTEAVATALRRYAEQLPDRETESRRVRVTMHGGIGGDDLLVVDGAGVDADGPLTGVLATGEVDPAALSAVLDTLAVEGIDPAAAGVAGGSLAVVVDRRDGPATVEVVESALAAVPSKATL